MLENAMPGEALLSNVVATESLKVASQNALPNKTLQEMAEKLEKSEAGRKKLRQAISMLKEKVEANEKVLQVNEILRQEYEKERQRAEAERNRAEEEKMLREQVEKEGLSTKEQLVRVLQRLDGVERNCKSDRNEIERMRKEMKEAISGLGGAVKAIEAAHSSFEGLEKNVLGKVNNAVSVSTKSTSLAEIAIRDAKGAQGTAVAAEKLSQSLVSRVTLLQKQGASLDQRVNLFQQEIRIREPELLSNELKFNGNRAANGVSLAADKPSGRGMVLSTNQQQAGGLSPKGTLAKVVSSEVNIVKPGDRDFVGKCGSLSPKSRHGANAAGITGVDTCPDSLAKDVALRSVSSAPVGGKAADCKSIPESSRGNIVREALDAAKEKRKLSRTTSSSKVFPLPGKSSSCQRSTMEILISNATYAAKDCLVEGEKFRDRDRVDSGRESMPALLENENNNDSWRSVPVSQGTASNYGSNREDCLRRRLWTRNKLSRVLDENYAKTRLVTVSPLLPAKEKIKSGTKIVTKEDKGEKLSVALLKDINKLFLREKKSRAKVEQKLAALQRVLQISEDDEVAKQGLVDNSVKKKSRKRKRRENSKDDSKKKRVQGLEELLYVTSRGDPLVTSLGDGVSGKVARRAVQVEASEWKSNNIAGEDDSAGPLQPPANNSLHLGPTGSDNDVPEAGLTTAAPEVIAPSQGIDMEVENISGYGLNKGWDSDSETSEGEFGEDWWAAKRVLLSPNLPEVQPPSLLLKEPDSNAPLPWPTGSGMNLEDVSLFLDVLPPIDQEVREEDRTEVTLTNVADSKSESEEMHIQSGGAALSGDQTEGQQPRHAKEILSDLRTCRESSTTSNSWVQCFENGCKPSDKSGVSVEDRKSESLIGESSILGSSMSSGSRPHSSLLLPQDDYVIIPPGKSEGLDDRLTVDTISSIDDGLRDSQGTVKEEKLDAEQCAAMEHVQNLSAYSLELVVGDSAYESGVKSTGSTMRQGPRTIKTDVSDKIMVAFGRTRKLLHVALNDSDDDTIGSGLAVAAEIASFFGSSTLSKLDLICIFTASLVDSHAMGDNEKTGSCFSSERKSLQLLVEILKHVLATEVFQNILPQDQAYLYFAVQLQKFLIEGRIQPGFEPIIQKAVAEGRSMEHFFHFTPPSSKLKRLKALISGGKLLAVFCETIGKLDFLCNSIYHVLRYCDMDSECLLATISSFACVGCKDLFSVDNDDVVGQAVRVVISELIHDAELGRLATAGSSAKIEEVMEYHMEMQQGPCKGAVEDRADCTEVLQNLKALKEVIGEEDGLSFESFVPRLVELFHRVITTTLGTHLRDNRHLFQRRLRMTTCNNQVEPRSLKAATIPDGSEKGFDTYRPDVACSVSNGSALQIGEKDDGKSPLVEDYCWRYIKARSSIQPVSQSERDATLGEEWEQKFYDITNAVELVASHLGWEWTYNDFIVEHLWKLVSPGAPAITVACVAYMFGLLGRLGREVDSTELPGVDELRKSLLVVLSSDQTSSDSSAGSCGHSFSFRAQVAAAQSLLVLSSLNRKDGIFPSKDPEGVFSKSSELHAKSVKCLWNWVKASKPEIQEILPSSLRCALLSIDKSNFVSIF